MVTAPPQLVWQLIKRNNCFIVNGLHGKKFSSEPGNLYNLHSYKHSGALARLARALALRVACSWSLLQGACCTACSCFPRRLGWTQQLAQHSIWLGRAPRSA